jgi:uncharacterized protein YceK
MMAHARIGWVIAQLRSLLVLVLVGGCSSCSARKDGPMTGPGQRVVAAINGLPDLLWCAPDERPVEAS